MSQASAAARAQRYPVLKCFMLPPGFLVRNLAPLSLAQKAADRVASRYPHLKTSLEYCQELKEALDQRGTPFFAGEQAGALDASCYGALCVWHAGGEESMEVSLLQPQSSLPSLPRSCVSSSILCLPVCAWSFFLLLVLRLDAYQVVLRSSAAADAVGGACSLQRRP